MFLQCPILPKRASLLVVVKVLPEVVGALTLQEEQEEDQQKQLWKS